MNLRRTYIYHEDGSHGWMEVEKDEIKHLKIESLISGYSFMDKDKVYLEEDQDAGIFINALIANQIFGSIEEFRGYITERYDENTFIRKLDRYKK